MTALTLYGSYVPNGTLTTACSLGNITGGTETAVLTTITGTTVYAELLSVGGTSASVTSIPTSPTGHGWVYCPGAGTFAAENWSAVLTMSLADHSSNGTATTTLRVFRYSPGGGTYTAIGSITTLTDTLAKTIYTFPATAFPASTFSATDLLYLDLWYHDAATRAGGDNPTLYLSSSAGAGVANDLVLTTPPFTSSTPTATHAVTGRAQVSRMVTRTRASCGRARVLQANAPLPWDPSWLSVSSSGHIVDATNRDFALHGVNTAGLEFGNGVSHYSQARIAAITQLLHVNLWRVCINVSWWNTNVLLPDGVTHYQDWIQELIRWCRAAECYIELDPTNYTLLLPRGSGTYCDTYGNLPQTEVDSDTFTHANQASGWPTASTGSTWTILSGSAGCSIVSNEGVITGPGGELYLKLGTTSANDQIGRVRFALHQTAAVAAGLLLRCTDSNTLYLISITLTHLSISKRVAGTWTTNLGTVAKTHTNGTFYWIQAYASGNTISLYTYQDGTEDPWNSYDLTITDESIAGGGFGLYASVQSGDSVQFDHFSIATPITTCIISQTTANTPPWTDRQKIDATIVFYRDILARYQCDPAIICNALNEPTAFADSVAANTEIATAIRSLAPTMLIFFYAGQYSLSPPNSYTLPNIVIDYHTYDDRPTNPWYGKFARQLAAVAYIQAQAQGVTIGEWRLDASSWNFTGYANEIVRRVLAYGNATTYYQESNLLNNDNVTLTLAGQHVASAYQQIINGLHPWYAPAYRYRRTITINHLQVSGGSDLWSFPVLISLTDTTLKTMANGGHVSNANGYDFLCIDATGATPLDHEIERYDATTGTLVLWVRLPILSASSDTVLFLYYGNSAITTPQANSTGVWAGYWYAGVWHLNSLALTDSTWYANTGTNSGGVVTTGKIATAVALSGNTALHIPESSSLAILPQQTGITLECWLFLSAAQAAQMDICGANGGYLLWFPSSSTIRCEDGQGHTATASYTFTPNQWYHVAVTVESNTASTVTFYINGAPVSTGASSATWTSTTGWGTYSVGSVLPGHSSFTGSIDEHRMLSFAQSAAWIATEYANQAAPASFYTVGSEQAVVLKRTVGRIGIIPPPGTHTPMARGRMRVSMLPGYTLYGSNVPNGTLTTACSLSSTTGGTESALLITTTGTTIYAELLSSVGTSSSVMTIPSIPTGKGWVAHPGAGTFAAGEWTAVLTMSLADHSNNGTSTTTIRYFRYTPGGGTYTAIGSITTLTDTLAKTVYAFPATSFPACTFSANDLLYIDLWYHDSGAYVGGDNPTIYVSSSAGAGVANDLVLTTPPFTALSPLRGGRGRMQTALRRARNALGRIATLGSFPRRTSGRISSRVPYLRRITGRTAFFIPRLLISQARLVTRAAQKLILSGMLRIKSPGTQASMGRFQIILPMQLLSQGRVQYAVALSKKGMARLRLHVQQTLTPAARLAASVRALPALHGRMDLAVQKTQGLAGRFREKIGQTITGAGRSRFQVSRRPRVPGRSALAVSVQKPTQGRLRMRVRLLHSLMAQWKLSSPHLFPRIQGRTALQVVPNRDIFTYLLFHIQGTHAPLENGLGRFRLSVTHTQGALAQMKLGTAPLSLLTTQAQFLLKTTIAQLTGGRGRMQLNIGQTLISTAALLLYAPGTLAGQGRLSLETVKTSKGKGRWLLSVIPSLLPPSAGRFSASISQTVSGKGRWQSDASQHKPIRAWFRTHVGGLLPGSIGTLLLHVRIHQAGRGRFPLSGVQQRLLNARLHGAIPRTQTGQGQYHGAAPGSPAMQGRLPLSAAWYQSMRGRISIAQEEVIPFWNGMTVISAPFTRASLARWSLRTLQRAHLHAHFRLNVTARQEGAGLFSLTTEMLDSVPTMVVELREGTLILEV